MHGAASCVTRNVWPPTMIAPPRASSLFGAILNVTVPAPAADDPAATVIHGTLAAAVHVQSARVVTFAVRSPPTDGTSIAEGENVKEQGAAAWVSVNVCVAMVAVAVRPAPGLPAASTFTDPPPVPAAPEAIVIQGALDAAVHGQWPPADTVTVALPPAAAIVPPGGVIL